MGQVKAKTQEEFEFLQSEVEALEKSLNNEITAMEMNYHDEYEAQYEDQHEHLNENESYLDNLAADIDAKKLRIRELTFENEYKIRKKEIKNYISQDNFILSDFDTNEDSLDRTQFAESISKLIANNKTLAPLTIGVFGEWGQGKSSFLNLIEKELNKINSCKTDTVSRTHIVKFDASEYNEQSKIWFSILQQLYSKFEEEKGLKARFKYSFRTFTSSLKNNKMKYIINSLILVFFSVWIQIFSRDKSLIDIIVNNNLVINLIGLFSSLAVTYNVILPLLKNLKFSVKPLSEKVLTHIKFPEYKEKLGDRESIKEDLNSLIDIWLKDKKKEKIVILIDELDRCSEKTIVEFFDALQLLIPIESIVNVISINKNAVCYALANNNQHFFESAVTNEQKIKFGMKYLQKYITIPFFLPNKKNYDNFVINLLNNEDNPLFNELQKEKIILTINKINTYYMITPREVKKLVNLLILAKERIIYTNNNNNNFILNFEEYSQWFLYQYFNPLSAQFIIASLSESYKYNKYKYLKDVKELNITSKINFQEICKIEKGSELLELLDDIRIEYIFLSNNISENFIS